MYLSASRPRVRQFRGLGTTVNDLSKAIARFEGSCPGGVCRNNNPGNLRAGPGSVGMDSRGFAIFPDAATGWSALDRQVGLNIDRGLSLSEFFGGKAGVYPGYAPAADSNNPGQYSGVVAKWLGISADVPLSGVIGGSSPGSDLPGPNPGASTSLWEQATALDSVYNTEDEGVSGWAIAGAALLAVGVIWSLS